MILQLIAFCFGRDPDMVLHDQDGNRGYGDDGGAANDNDCDEEDGMEQRLIHGRSGRRAPRSTVTPLQYFRLSIRSHP